MTQAEYHRLSTFRPDYAVKRQQGGALHTVHPDHPGVAFCAAEVGDPLPADSPLRRRSWCRQCRLWFHMWLNNGLQDAFWDEERLTAEHRAPFRPEHTDEDREIWRSDYNRRAQTRAMHPRDAIADFHQRYSLKGNKDDTWSKTKKVQAS